MIRVQQEDFDIGAEIAALKAGRSDIGAIVTFIGTVRDQHGAVAGVDRNRNGASAGHRIALFPGSE